MRPHRLATTAALGACIGALTICASSAQAVINSCTGVGTTFAGGAGTTASPYQVATPAQLAGITSGYRACAFIQTANIDISGGQWTPIGATSGNAFTGTYDGQSHTVSGLTISQSGSDGNGLFGFTNGATISNITVSGVMIDTYTNASYRRKKNGALIGVATATVVTGAHSTGSIDGHEDNGGLIGVASGATISSSSSSATVAGHGWDSGGLVGASNGATSITSSFATGNVTNAGWFTGGLVGGMWGSPTITRSYATGNVSYTGGRGAGYQGWGTAGLIGLMDVSAGSVTESYATGDVAGGRRGTGGLLGSAWRVTLSNSYATGDVTGDVDDDGTFTIGGLWGGASGQQAQTITITNSYATGAVTSFPSGAGGGLFGAVRNPAAGSTQPNITNSFWSTGTAGSGVSSPYGTQATVAEMKSLALYAGASWTIADGWASSGTWGICDGDGYPFLMWQYSAGSRPCSASASPATSIPASPADAGTSSAPRAEARATAVLRLLANKPIRRGRWVVTTGRVPTGATVVVQKATRRVAGRGRSARSEHGVSRAIACRMGITRAGVRTFHCANSLQAGTWDLTTEARNGSTVIARVTRSMTLRAQARLPVTG